MTEKIKKILIEVISIYGAAIIAYFLYDFLVDYCLDVRWHIPQLLTEILAIISFGGIPLIFYAIHYLIEEKIKILNEKETIILFVLSVLILFTVIAVVNHGVRINCPI